MKPKKHKAQEDYEDARTLRIVLIVGLMEVAPDDQVLATGQRSLRYMADASSQNYISKWGGVKILKLKEISRS